MFGRANAAGRAIGIKQAAALPCTAHSLTREEVRGLVKKKLIRMATGYSLFALVLAAVIGLSGFDTLEMRLYAGMVGSIMLVGAVAAMWRVRRRADYVAPLIRIEIKDAGIELRRSGGSEAISYAELVVSDILMLTSRYGVDFEGILLETSSGPLRLGNNWFAGGNPAAGAILKRMDQLGVPLRLRGGIFS